MYKKGNRVYYFIGLFYLREKQCYDIINSEKGLEGKSMEYIFNIANIEDTDLIQQISKAFEKRTEFLSRKKYPKLWQYADSHKTKKTLTEKEVKGQRIRTRLLGTVNLALGIFLFVPGLMKPDELFIPLIVGAIAIGAGIGAFWRSRKNKRNPFDKSAKLLFEQRNKIPSEQNAKVIFSENGMKIISEADNEKNDEFVEYSDFENIISTKDIILLIYKEKCVLLQKKELVSENINAFCEFISIKTGCYHSIEE